MAVTIQLEYEFTMAPFQLVQLFKIEAQQKKESKPKADSIS